MQHITQAKATELSTSTEKPFAGDESLTEQERNTELKDLIVYVEKLPTKDTYPDVTIDTNDYGDFFKPIANQDNLPKSPKAVSGDMGGAPEWFTAIYNDKTLLTIGGRDITVKETFWAASGTLVIILIVVAICLAVSFWKRKRIAAEARRASNYIRRSTATLRASIRKARGKPTPEEEVKPMTDQEINKVANEQGANKGEKELLKDMMKA